MKKSNNNSLAINVFLHFLSDFRIKNVMYEWLVQQIVDWAQLAHIGKTLNSWSRDGDRLVSGNDSAVAEDLWHS